MSAEASIESLKQINFKEVNSLCSKHGINTKVDDHSIKKFETSLKTAHLLITQPIEIAISRETKMTSLQSLRDMKKVLDSIYLVTKEQKFKNYLDNLNEIMINSKVK